MANLKEELNKRIEKMGEGLSTDDPLLADAIILISRTLIDIREDEARERDDGVVRVDIDKPLRMDFMGSYRFENILSSYDRQFNRMISAANRIEDSSVEFGNSVDELSKSIKWLTGGVVWICLMMTVALVWILLT